MGDLSVRVVIGKRSVAQCHQLSPKLGRQKGGFLGRSVTLSRLTLILRSQRTRQRCQAKQNRETCPPQITAIIPPSSHLDPRKLQFSPCMPAGAVWPDSSADGARVKSVTVYYTVCQASWLILGRNEGRLHAGTLLVIGRAHGIDSRVWRRTVTFFFKQGNNGA